MSQLLHTWNLKPREQLEMKRKREINLGWTL